MHKVINTSQQKTGKAVAGQVKGKLLVTGQRAGIAHSG